MHRFFRGHNQTVVADDGGLQRGHLKDMCNCSLNCLKRLVEKSLGFFSRVGAKAEATMGRHCSFLVCGPKPRVSQKAPRCFWSD